MKYCGVYTCCAMGIPGSVTALEELMCRVLGDFLVEGYVANLTNDLYCVGNSLEDLSSTWRKFLPTLSRASLRLSVSKTIIYPKQISILGWIWSKGSLTAGPHRIATLSSCQSPKTVKGQRSFVGAYNVLNCVIPNCSHFLSPLDEAIARNESQEAIVWSDCLHEVSIAAQRHLTAGSYGRVLCWGSSLLQTSG